jgi:hypothetical protein
MSALRCDMTRECAAPVSHIGEKGYAYCTHHAANRQYVERCRRLRAWELRQLAAGQPLKSYEYQPRRNTTDELVKA